MANTETNKGVIIRIEVADISTERLNKLKKDLKGIKDRYGATIEGEAMIVDIFTI